MIGRGGMGSKKMAILGGRGMLGTDLAVACTRRGFDVQVHDLPECDITNSEHLRQVVRNADLIVNCAAYTNVDGAETQAELAHRVNGEAVGRLGELARQNGRWVLHISTDFVFDGRLDRPYVETDTPNPINQYGKSKLAGERLLRESGCSHCIIRLEWMYGLHGRSFITKLVERARTNETLKVVSDQVGSPTATTEVARVICDLSERRTEGVFHFASGGYVSRYEMAVFILEHLGLEIGLEPCRTADYPAPAARPLNSRFDCTRMQRLRGEPARPWQDPLGEFLRQI
jgi:dTDP-4-dehydrorhamnose reductase